MAWFTKKEKIIDLSAKYKQDQEKIANIQTENNTAPTTTATDTGFGFFGAIAKTASTNENSPNETIDLSIPEERKKRLAKRLTDMTEKLEELSNQIYHLQQRVEVLEKKSDRTY